MIFMLFPLFEGCDMLFSSPQLYSAAFYFLRSTPWEPAIPFNISVKVGHWGLAYLGTYGTHRLTLCVKETSRADDFYAPFRFLKVVICSSVLFSYIPLCCLLLSMYSQVSIKRASLLNNSYKTRALEPIGAKPYFTLKFLFVILKNLSQQVIWLLNQITLRCQLSIFNCFKSCTVI